MSIIENATKLKGVSCNHPHFKSIPTNSIEKMSIFFFKLNLEGNLKFSFQNLEENNGDRIGESNHMDGI